MRIGVFCVSIYPDKQPEFALVNRQRLEFYCKKHNYDLNYLTEFITDAKCVRGKYKWNGFWLIKNMMNDKKYDACMWIDNDIFIANPSMRIEDFMDQTSKDMIFSRDIDWTPDTSFITMINAGIYILKNTPNTLRFINKAWRLRNFTKHGSHFTDQATINMIIINEFIDHAEIMPLGTLQQLIFHLKSGQKPFCLHTAGSAAKQQLYTDITRKYIHTSCPECNNKLLQEILQHPHHKLLTIGAHGYYTYARCKTNKVLQNI